MGATLRNYLSVTEYHADRVDDAVDRTNFVEVYLGVGWLRRGVTKTFIYTLTAR